VEIGSDWVNEHVQWIHRLLIKYTETNEAGREINIFLVQVLKGI
jgi:hypothetical protein